ATGDAILATFESLGRIFETLSTAVQPFFEGLRDVAVALLPRFEEFAGFLADAAANFGAFLSEGAETGAIVDAFDRAVETFLMFVDLAQQVGRIISAVFTAASESGAGFSSVLGGLLENLAAIAESAEGQAALGE